MTPPPLNKAPQEDEKETPERLESFAVHGVTTIKLLQRIEDEGLEKVWFDER